MSKQQTKPFQVVTKPGRASRRSIVQANKRAHEEAIKRRLNEAFERATS